MIGVGIVVRAEYVATDGTRFQYQTAVTREALDVDPAALTWALRRVTMELINALKEASVPLAPGESIRVWSEAVE